MTRTKLFLAALTILVAGFPEWAPPFAAGAEEPKPKSFAVPGHGDLELSVPDGWKDSVQPAPQPGLPPAIEFTTDGKKFSVLVSVLTAPREKAGGAVGGAKGFNAPDRLRKLAEQGGQGMLPTSKEKTLAVEEVKGANATGYFYTLTDKAPDPGSFEYVTAGVVGVGDLLLTVTILHHHKDAPERQAALDVFKTASQKAGAANAAAQAADLRVRAPGDVWELVIPGKGLKIVEDQSDAARKSRQVTAVDEESGLIVSVFLEPARKAGDSRAVRDAYWGRAKTSPLKKEGVKLDAAGEFATVQYTVPDVEGERINQKNVNLYAARDGVWVDVHLSKTQFTDKDQAMIDRLLKETKFVKPPAEHH